MISKELLSEVLGREVTNIIIDWNTIHISPYTEKEICPSCGCGIKHMNHRIWACVNDACSVSGDYEFSKPIYSDDSSINIYELAHKCKEWAWKENYMVPVWKRYRNNFNKEIFYEAWLKFAFDETNIYKTLEL